MSAIDIKTEQDFTDKIIKSDRPVLVNFWAKWCGGCRLMEPVIDLIACELKDKAVVAKVNVLENRDTANKYGGRFIPIIRIFKNGEIVDSLSGNAPKEVIIKKISHYV